MVSAKKFSKKRILSIIITVILVVCAASMVATKLIYDSIFARYDQSVEIPEALTGMVEQRRVCRFPSGENMLTGYYYGVSEPEYAHGLILLAPGFSAGGDDYLWQIRELLDYGWGIFTFDATGTGRSQGESQVGFCQLIPDLEAALKYVENNRRFGYNNLVLMGHSRGAYAACCMLDQSRDVAAVVSVSGVNSAMESIMQASNQYVGIMSYGNYGLLWLYQAMLFGADTLQLQVAQILNKTETPVLLVHGTKDRKIPVDTASIVSHREQITADQVEYLLCDGGHTDLMYDADGTANNDLIRQIHEFLLNSLEG